MKRFFYFIVFLLLLSSPGCVTDIVEEIMEYDGHVDYDGKRFYYKKIGTLYWLVDNLETGDILMSYSIADSQKNDNHTEMYYYKNDGTRYSYYGGYYQWGEAMQYNSGQAIQGICPPGFHIPTYDEFGMLAAAVYNDATSLKNKREGAGIGKGTNSSGFDAYLAGIRTVDGVFYYNMTIASFWSSTSPSGNAGAYAMRLDGISKNIEIGLYDKREAHNVRCVMDHH